MRRDRLPERGTFEFLLGPDGSFYFIEVNCRLQVEHPVTEVVTGIDIVREQVRIAAGERLRLTGRATPRARDRGAHQRRGPRAGTSRPGPEQCGRSGRRSGGVRVDTAIVDGCEIPPYYDSLVAKLIVWDDTRPAAIARALRALTELGVDGIPTTRELALDVLLPGVRERRVLDLDARRARRPRAVADRMSPVGRRAGRRQALFLLYQWDLTGQPLASLYEASRTRSPRARRGRLGACL